MTTLGAKGLNNKNYNKQNNNNNNNKKLLINM